MSKKRSEDLPAITLKITDAKLSRDAQGYDAIVQIETEGGGRFNLDLDANALQSLITALVDDMADSLRHSLMIVDMYDKRREKEREEEAKAEPASNAEPAKKKRKHPVQSS